MLSEQEEFVDRFLAKERGNPIHNIEDVRHGPINSAEVTFRSTLPSFKIELDTRFDPLQKQAKVKLPKQRLLTKMTEEGPTIRSLRPLETSPRRKKLERASLKHSQLGMFEAVKSPRLASTADQHRFRGGNPQEDGMEENNPLLSELASSLVDFQAVTQESQEQI